MALLNLLRLSRITGETVWEEKAERLMRGLCRHRTGGSLMAYTQFLNGVDWVVGPAQEMVIAGDPGHPVSRAMVRAASAGFPAQQGPAVQISRAGRGTAGADRPFRRGYRASGCQKPEAYICEQYACRRPLSEISELEDIIYEI